MSFEQLRALLETANTSHAIRGHWLDQLEHLDKMEEKHGEKRSISALIGRGRPGEREDGLFFIQSCSGRSCDGTHFAVLALGSDGPHILDSFDNAQEASEFAMATKTDYEQFIVALDTGRINHEDASLWEALKTFAPTSRTYTKRMQVPENVTEARPSVAIIQREDEGDHYGQFVVVTSGQLAGHIVQEDATNIEEAERVAQFEYDKLARAVEIAQERFHDQRPTLQEIVQIGLEVEEEAAKVIGFEKPIDLESKDITITPDMDWDSILEE